MDKPLEFHEIRTGMTLWDNKKKRIQKVLRVWLWKEMIENEQNRYFLKKPTT